MTCYVYVISCEDNSYYTGYTKNVELRMKLHLEGRGARYTRMHKPKRLIYVEKMNSKSDAMKRERQIKNLNHRQKQKLIIKKKQ